jgi:2,3-bisphosphoglycerate-dependent phosphoglycerate mutase
VTLVLLRHAESSGNAEDRFTGWLDVGLTTVGEEQARRAGVLLRERGLAPGVVFASALVRTARTAELCLAAAIEDAVERPAVVRTWRLNERHYGALQGRPRAEVDRECGAEQVRQWRRSWTGTPPRLPDDVPNPADDARYAGCFAEAPRTESLADVARRVTPFWRDELAPALAAHDCVLVVGHSNSLRALMVVTGWAGAEQACATEIAVGEPLAVDVNRPVREASSSAP